MALKVRPDLHSDFNKALKDDINKVVSTTNYGNNSSYDYRDRINAKFFEWSDLNREPKSFTSSRELFKFFDECKIEYTNQQRDDIERRYTLYIICPLNSNKIVFDYSLDKLKEALSVNTNTK